jgi:hypothetical protein
MFLSYAARPQGLRRSRLEQILSWCIRVEHRFSSALGELPVNPPFRGCEKLVQAFGGSPLLQQGELDFSPGEKRSILKLGFSPGISPSRR